MTEEQWRVEFARRLRVLMRTQDLKQYQLAELAGVSDKTISHYLNKTRIPDAITAVNLSKALNCNISDLIPNHEWVD